MPARLNSPCAASRSGILLLRSRCTFGTLTFLTGPMLALAALCGAHWLGSIPGPDGML
jgi:hypothetical protein